MTDNDFNSQDYVDRLQIGTPCHMKWDDLQGNGAVRYCGECRLNVHDLTAMTRVDAETFVRDAEERVCARMVRRADGRVLTKDCGPVRTALRRRVRRLRIAAAALLGLVGTFGFGCGAPAASSGTGGGGAEVPVTPANGGAAGSGSETPDIPDIEVLGDICIPEDDLQPIPKDGSDVEPTELMGEVMAPEPVETVTPPEFDERLGRVLRPRDPPQKDEPQR